MGSIINLSNNFATERSLYSSFATYPTSDSAWVDRYDRLWSTYLGEPYDVSEVKHFHLFRALDDDGKDIDITKRITTLYRFIVDTDVGATLGGRLTLELAGNNADKKNVDPARAALLAEGEAVWRRSAFDERAEVWVRSMAAMGDHYVEAVRLSGTKPHKTTLVGYDCRNVVPVYDQATSTRLEKIIMTSAYHDPPTVGANGVVEDGVPHVYRREVDAVNVNVYLDGKHQAELSGPHGLGVIPAVHLQFTPFTEADHGLPAAVGVDQACMAIDSMVTQVKAIANRHANPIGFIKGAKLTADGQADIGKFGRWIGNLPADSDIGYLEATGGMIAEIIAQTSQLLDTIQKTEPEFLFADTAAASGEARSYKAAALENKIGGVRARLFSALARVTGYAVAMDRHVPYDPDTEVFKVEAGPILPRNNAKEVETLNSIKAAITPADFVRHLQRLGLVGREHDPEEYVALVKASSVAPVVVADVADPNAGDEAPPQPSAKPPAST